MANLNDPVFEIDAGKILAKLHLAGQQQLQGKKIEIINSGIINPVANADPANPGNVEFDLDNKSGEYQFAVLRILEYKIPINISKNKTIIKLYTEIKKAKEKQNLTDKAKGKESIVHKAQEKLLEILDSIKLKEYKSDPDNFEESIKKFNEAIVKENEERQKAQEDYIKKQQKLALDDIKEYFKTISGEKNASKIKESDIVWLNADVPEKLIKNQTDFKDIKDYKIIPNVDKEIKKYEQNLQENTDPAKFKDGPKLQRNIMFVVGFEVEIETM